MAGDGVGVVSRGDGDVPLPEAATLSSAPLYGSTASPTRGRRSSVRARGFQFWREVEGAVPVLGRVGSTMEVEEPARTMSGGHDSVAAAAAAFSLHAVRRLDTAPAPIAATAGKNSVMAASSIDGSRGGGFPGASSSMVAWMAFCSPLHQLQLQQHGGRELSPAPVYSLHPPPSSGDAPISKPPIEPSSSRFQSQHAFAAAAAAAHRNTILWRVVQNVLPWKTKDRTSGESKSSGIMWSFAAGSNLSTSTGFNAEKESRKNLNKFYKELRTLNTVNMAGRQFGDEGLFFLAESLAYNKSAEEVDFSSNGITVVGIEAFDGILQINTALKTLNLSGNAIGDEGAKIYW